MNNTASNKKASAGVCLAWIKPEPKAGICLAWIDQNGPANASSRPSVSLNLENLE